MIIQLIDIFYPHVFRRYSAKYNIYRNLYEKDLLAIEFRSVEKKLAHRIKKIVLANNEICYVTQTSDDEYYDVLSIGSLTFFRELAKEIIAIGNEDTGLRLSRLLHNLINYDQNRIQIGQKEFNMSRAYVVGILNVTPDSFSDGGKFFEKNKAVEHAFELIEQGADIIDIGGESSRPGADPIPATEEINRVLPVIEEIIKSKSDVLISVDTTKSEVAEEALKAGAKIVNDISSFAFDARMPEIIKKFEATAILMHMKGTPKSMQNNPEYNDVVNDIYDYFVETCNKAEKIGIKKIIIDPGIGFGKKVHHNYELLNRLDEFKGIGYPILVGLSRKSFLGKALNLPVELRDAPTLAAETLAVKNGARFIRTHNVTNGRFAILINNFIENPELLIND
ncbi:dihydropteroate synthase [Melioribacter sp. OK-6-Me]|uniref:dihydropteroate synthase n=1 Tax=unclassified Melioribacter TaxID=2627329 RepID=UPI003ED9E41B